MHLYIYYFSYLVFKYLCACDSSLLIAMLHHSLSNYGGQEGNNESLQGEFVVKVILLGLIAGGRGDHGPWLLEEGFFLNFLIGWQSSYGRIPSILEEFLGTG